MVRAANEQALRKYNKESVYRRSEHATVCRGDPWVAFSGPHDERFPENINVFVSGVAIARTGPGLREPTNWQHACASGCGLNEEKQGDISTLRSVSLSAFHGHCDHLYG